MSAPRRTEQDMLAEASTLLERILRVHGRAGELTGYGESGTVDYVLGAARAVHRLGWDQSSELATLREANQVLTARLSRSRSGRPLPPERH